MAFLSHYAVAACQPRSREVRMKTFTVCEYLEALRQDPEGLAFVTVAMAADAISQKGFRLTRTGVIRLTKTQLVPIKIGKTVHVSSKSVGQYIKQREEQVTKVRAYLDRVAGRHETVFYEKVMARVGLSTTVPADRKRIGAILGLISEETHKKHRFALTAIVH